MKRATWQGTYKFIQNSVQQAFSKLLHNALGKAQGSVGMLQARQGRYSYALVPCRSATARAKNSRRGMPW
jgi:hypothetical protein